jgi:O-antigen ligase
VSGQFLSYPQPVFVINKVRGSEKASMFSILVLVLAFSASIFGTLAAGMTGVPFVNKAIQAAAMLYLFVYSFFNTKRFSFDAIPRNLKLSLISVILITLLLGILDYYTTIVPRPLRTSALLKALGVILSLVAILFSARVFTYKEIVRALIIYSIIEFAGCYYLHTVGSDVNANALAVRMSVSAMVLFTLTKFWGFRLIGILCCLVFSITLGCRTSFVAFTGAMVFLYFEKNSRNRRELMLALTIVMTGLLLLFLPTIVGALRQLALSFLSTDNLFVEYLLEDRRVDRIRYDFFNRNAVWEYSWSFIREKPWFGNGLGTEQALMGARSHSAYLSLLFEGGVFHLICWMYFYIWSVFHLFRQRSNHESEESPLYSLAILLLGYMLLAGIVETSGIASVSTPINLIFMFLMVWISPRKSKR